MSKSSSTVGSSDIVLALIVEGVGIGVLALLAGISDDVGTVVVVFMVGLWLLFLINHQGVQGYVNNLFQNVQGTLNG